MFMPLAIAALLSGPQQTPPVPGLCTEPAAEHPGQPGCYLSAQIPISQGQEPLFWHIVAFPDGVSARAEASRHRTATVIQAYGQTWLYVLDEKQGAIGVGETRAIIGPLRRPEGTALVARFLESTFPPGMKTRSHAHPGPEAFYVVDGEQCMESPTHQARIAAGQTYVIEAGPHLQAAPTGRRNLVVLILPADEAWMTLSPEWVPSDYCER